MTSGSSACARSGRVRVFLPSLLLLDARKGRRSADAGPAPATELAALVQEPKTADLGAINGALQADVGPHSPLVPPHPRASSSLLCPPRPRKQIADKQARLATLRSGAPPIPAAAIASADQAWTAERAQWVARRRTYGAVVDGLMGETVSADQRAAWEDDVGVDAEVPEVRSRTVPPLLAETPAHGRWADRGRPSRRPPLQVARALESSALVLAPPTTATSRLPAPAVVSAGCSSKRKTSGAGKAAGGSKKARTAGGES